MMGVCQRKVVPLLDATIPSLRAVYLFGSAASGRLRSSSDVDLALLAGEAIDPITLFELSQRCAQACEREVDLIDLKRAPLVLRAQVIGQGIRLKPEGKGAELDFYENQILSQYLAFVEERRPLVDEILRRRSIHAA